MPGRDLEGEGDARRLVAGDALVAREVDDPLAAQELLVDVAAPVRSVDRLDVERDERLLAILGLDNIPAWIILIEQGR